MRRLQVTSFNKNNAWKVALITLAILFAFASGLSVFILQSPYTPLIILAVVAGFIAIFTWIEKPIWALYFTIFAVLLPDSLIPAQVNSYINRFATIIALAVWIIDIIRHRRRIIISTSTLLMALFILWSAVTLLWAEYFSEGSTALQRYIIRMVLFLLLVINQIKTRKELDGLMGILALNGWVYVAVSVQSIIMQGYTSGTRLQVLDINENSLGLSLLFTLPAVFWWAFYSSKGSNSIKKLLAVIFLLATIGFTGLSGSRGSAISIGLTVLAFLFWRPTRKWGIFSAVLIAVALITAPIIFSTTIERFIGSPGQSVLGGREIMWPAGWELIKANPFLGVGIGNSPYAVLPLVSNIIVRLLLRQSVSIHNPVLIIWAETGLPGILLYLGILIAAIYSFVKQFMYARKSGDQRMLPYFALISSVFVGFMASWIKGGGMESSHSFFLMLALLWIPAYINGNRIDQRSGISSQI